MVIFSEENPWQRHQVTRVLSSLIAENAFIRPNKNGDVITTSLTDSENLDDIMYCLNRAAQLPLPGEKAIPIHKIDVNNQFL